MYINLWQNYWGHRDHVRLFCFKFLKLLTVSDKAIYKALRTQNSIKQNTLKTFFILTFYQTIRLL